MPVGYVISGIEPFELRRYPESVRLLYWTWVSDLGLIAKRRDLEEGLDAFGEPMTISEETRRHRKSEMTPDGKGDPSAPPLSPGHKLSRVQSLLAAKATTDHAEFWWRFDPWTGDSFSKILTFQQEQGRDVFGLSPASLAWVQGEALARWNRWKRTSGQVPPELVGRHEIGPFDYRGYKAPYYPEMPGKRPTALTTEGIGERTRKEGWRGLMTEKELREWMRGRAPANVPMMPGEDFNRLLAHTWGTPGQFPTGGGAIQPLPLPKHPRKTQVAAIASLVREKPIQKPVVPAVLKQPLEDFAFAARAAARLVDTSVKLADGSVMIEDAYAVYRQFHPEVSLELFRQLMRRASDAGLIRLAGELITP